MSERTLLPELRAALIDRAAGLSRSPTSEAATLERGDPDLKLGTSSNPDGRRSPRRALLVGAVLVVVVAAIGFARLAQDGEDRPGVATIPNSPSVMAPEEPSSSISAVTPPGPLLKEAPIGGNFLVFESEPDNLDFANEILDPAEACGERQRGGSTSQPIPGLEPLAALRLDDVVVCLHQRARGNLIHTEFTVDDVVESTTLSDDCSGPNRGLGLLGTTRQLDDDRSISFGTAPVAAFALGPDRPPYTGLSRIAPAGDRVGLYAKWPSPSSTATSSAIYITADRLGDIPEPVLDIDACPDDAPPPVQNQAEPGVRHGTISVPSYDGPATTDALIAAFEGWIECLEETGLVIASAELRVSEYNVQADWSSQGDNQRPDDYSDDPDELDRVRRTCQVDFLAVQSAWTDSEREDLPAEVEERIDGECGHVELQDRGLCEDRIRSEVEALSMKTVYRR